jgi:hypothetical protein
VSGHHPAPARCFLFLKRHDAGGFHPVWPLMKNRAPMTVCDHFASTFADSGQNMNLKTNATREQAGTDAMLRPRYAGVQTALDRA